jgi:hypothetical protein
VYFSPLRRAVATGKIAMEEHPNHVNGSVKFKLIPWFRETMKSQCDLAFHTKKIHEKYPDLDLSLV